MFNWNKKEKPFVSYSGMGGGGTGLVFGSGSSGPNIDASGGTKVPHIDSPDGRTYHIFTGAGPANFDVTTAGGENIEVLLIGGGGGGQSGGDSAGGGGGAGGLVYRHSVPISNGTQYPISIGSGGSGASNGGNTTGFSLTALGGGQGCGRSGSSTPGGNGGGGSAYSGVPNKAEGSGTQPGQNPGVPNLTQYGNPGYSPDDSGATHYKFSCGGSGNANNNYLENASFPNGSTIISDAPPAISTKNLARGGYYSTSPQWADDDYGCGGRGTPGGNAGGEVGVVVVRYGIAP